MGTILGPNPTINGCSVIGNELKTALANASKRSIFRSAVGYISDAGTNSIKPDLIKIISNGGSVEIIVGLNQVTQKSIKALGTLSTICAGVGIFVFWNPNLRVTFHPKCYLLKPPKSQTLKVWIGSSNLTQFGLYNNYECNLYFPLSQKNDKVFISEIEYFYSQIRNSPFCHAVDTNLLTQLKALKKLPQGEHPTPNSTVTDGELENIFNKKKELKIKSKTFVMTLAGNDISGKRGEPYFLIPLAATKGNTRFWGLPLKIPQGSTYPTKYIYATVKIKNSKTVENRRIYYVGGKTELRFVSPKIYNLGLSYVGSILTISKNKTGYNLEVFNKSSPKYSGLLKYASNIASNQKMWGYT
jgi:HKD family nuclease